MFRLFRLFVVSGLLGWWSIVMLMVRFGVMCRVFYSRGVLSLVGNLGLHLLGKGIAFSRREAVPFFSSKCAIDIAMPVENASGSHLVASIGESIGETKVLVNFGHMKFIVVSCIVIGIIAIEQGCSSDGTYSKKDGRCTGNCYLLPSDFVFRFTTGFLVGCWLFCCSVDGLVFSVHSCDIFVVCKNVLMLQNYNPAKALSRLWPVFSTKHSVLVTKCPCEMRFCITSPKYYFFW